MADTKTFVDRGYNHARKQAKMEQEEKELAELQAKINGEVVEEQEEEEEEEVTQEEAVEPTQEEDGPEPTSAEERSFKKRYGDLRRHMQQKEKEYEEKLKAAADNVVPPKTEADLKAWAAKYPDVANIVESIATKKAQEMFEKADARFKKLDEAENEAKRINSENAIRKSHPDFDTLKESDEFHVWAEEQPKWVQDALYENADDPASVVRVIDLYKVDNGMTPSAKKEKAKAAATSTPRGSRSAIDPDETSKKFTESQVRKMSDKEFEANMDAITEAQRTGKFVYDLTGAAR
jgi:hypothetical protein